jgi:hypothetical protein
MHDSLGTVGYRALQERAQGISSRKIYNSFIFACSLLVTGIEGAACV